MDSNCVSEQLRYNIKLIKNFIKILNQLEILDKKVLIKIQRNQLQLKFLEELLNQSSKDFLTIVNNLNN